MRIFIGMCLATSVVAGSFFVTLAVLESAPAPVVLAKGAIPLPRHKPLSLRAEQNLASLLERQVVNRALKSDRLEVAEICGCGHDEEDESKVLASQLR